MRGVNNMFNRQYRYTYNNRSYEPVKPQPDTHDLAENNERLIMVHDRETGPEFIIARRGYVNAGWVVGLFS